MFYATYFRLVEEFEVARRKREKGINGLAAGTPRGIAPREGWGTADGISNAREMIPKCPGSGNQL
jgi:hypothetical protein